MPHHCRTSRPVCFSPCPLSCSAGRAVWSWKDRGWVVSRVRSENCKDRGRQGFTQSNPDPSAASEPFCPPWPSSLTCPHWPAHSRDVSPGLFSHRLSSAWDVPPLVPTGGRRSFQISVSLSPSPESPSLCSEVTVPGRPCRPLDWHVYHAP